MSFLTGKKRFTYLDILHITNNLEKVLGEGGFGTVYFGHLDNSTKVAVKMLKPTLSGEGYKQFHTEAEILLVVHHANLASMIGYYHEGKHLGVVYEYMSNGNLEDNLSVGKKTFIFYFIFLIQSKSNYVNHPTVRLQRQHV